MSPRWGSPETQLGVAAALSVAAMLLSPHLAPGLTSAGIVLAGLLLTLTACRAIDAGRRLTTIVVAAYVVKVAAAAVLFYVSLWQVPILDGLRLGAGFWRFSLDSLEYNRVSALIFAAWKQRTVLPELGPEVGQLFYVTLVYRLLGAVPLHVSLLNAWFGSLGVLTAVLIVRRRAADPWSVAAVAVLIGFWPSLILWSTQMQKDPVAIALLLVQIGVVARLLEGPAARRRVEVACWLLAAFVAFVLQFTRPYIPMIAAAAAAVVGASTALLDVVRGRGWWRAARSVAVVAVVLGATLGSSKVQLSQLFRNTRTELGYVHLGVAYQEAGRPDLAADAYADALHVNGTYSLAVRNLALAYLDQGLAPKALAWLAQYRGMRMLPDDGPRVEAQIRGLRSFLAGGRWPATRLAPVDVDPWATGSRWRDFNAGFASGTSALDLLETATPRRMAALRSGMLREGGSVMVLPKVRVDNVPELLAFAPRAAIAALWAPFPWQWFDAEHRGGVKAFASAETFLLYLLIPCVAWALVAVWRRRDPVDCTILIFVALLATGIGIAVPTLGTLFRVRLQVVAPLVVLLGATDSFARVRDLMTRGPRTSR